MNTTGTLDALRDYYLRGLDHAEHPRFLAMIGEMGHLKTEEQVSAFAMVYMLDMSIPRGVIASAIGYVEKSIARGLR